MDSCGQRLSSFFIASTISVILFVPTVTWLNLLCSNQNLIKPSIQNLFVPHLINNSTNNYSIFFNLQLKDDAYNMGVYYDNLTLDFFFLGNHPSIIPTATYNLPGFYQEGGISGSSFQISDQVKTRGIELSSSTEVVVFRVEMESEARFKQLLWKSKKYELKVKGEVEVNIVSGRNVEKNGVELESSTHNSGRVIYTMFIVVSYCIGVPLVLTWFVSLRCLYWPYVLAFQHWFYECVTGRIP